MQIHELMRVCGALAPEPLCEEWDNVGLQVGDPAADTTQVFLCLDVTPAVVEEALAVGADCIIAHHPLIFRPLRSLREDRPEARLVAALLRAGVALYVMHTNLDSALPGTSDALAALLGVSDLRPLAPLDRPVGKRHYKLVVFVPATAVDRVRTALGDAGAGVIGAYSHCSFSVLGTGSFRPLTGAHPTIGTVGTQERVPEERVEVVVPAGILPRVLEAMLAAHPYEEVAYDLYPLAPPPTGAGLGRVGTLDAPCTLADLEARVRDRLPVSGVAVVGDRARTLERVALCGGSGGDLIPTAAAAGAQVLVTGDVKHHQALLARDLGLAVIDAGHYATERPVLDWLAAALRDRLPAEVQVCVSALSTDPFLA